MKFNFLYDLMKAETLSQAYGAVNALLEVLRPPNAMINIEAMRGTLAPHVQTLTETQTADKREALLFTLYVTSKHAFENNNIYQYFLCSLLIELMLFHEARKELSLTMETTEKCFHVWQAGERQTIEAQKYIALQDTIERLSQHVHRLWIMHEANRLCLVRLHTSVQIGCRMINTKLNELAQANSPENKAEITLLKKVLGDEEPVWAVAPADAPWSLNGFKYHLAREITTVKCITKTKASGWFNTFSQGVTTTILEPLKTCEKEKSFVIKIKEWMQDTLYQFFGSTTLSTKRTLHNIMDMANGLFKTSVASKNPTMKGNDLNHTRNPSLNRVVKP
jgi:hypothetical protein